MSEPSESDPPGGATPRRDFLDWILGASILGTAGSAAYPILAYLLPPPQRGASPDAVVAAKSDELQPNSGKIVRFGVKAALLVRRPDGAYCAFYAACTHLDCTVQYRSDLQAIHCACHNGMYDLEGRNVSGPPPRPLDRLGVKQRGADVVIVRES